MKVHNQHIDEGLIREAVRVALDEAKSVSRPMAPSSADMNDAWQVFRDWLSIGDPYMKSKFGFRYIDDVKELFFSQRDNVMKLPISSVETFADFGRRPKGKRLENTIVVVQVPGTKMYQVLDGQHRVHQLRSQGAKTVNAAVIVLPGHTRPANDARSQHDRSTKRRGKRPSALASMLRRRPKKSER